MSAPNGVPNATVRERPIRFSGPMVRALLDGSKTQTRRVVKPQPTNRGAGWHGEWVIETRMAITSVASINLGAYPEVCPYGAPGDRLWVRETVRCFEWMDGGETSVEYVADGALHDDAEWVWKRDSLPSIHMPRGLCRIRLELTDVRVERLQEISHDDATAEGVFSLPDADLHNAARRASSRGRRSVDAVDYYAELWDSLNAKRGHGWDVNPWVWCLSFRRVEAPR